MTSTRSRCQSARCGLGKPFLSLSLLGCSSSWQQGQQPHRLPTSPPGHVLCFTCINHTAVLQAKVWIHIAHPIMTVCPDMPKSHAGLGQRQRADHHWGQSKGTLRKDPANLWCFGISGCLDLPVSQKYTVCNLHLQLWPQMADCMSGLMHLVYGDDLESLLSSTRCVWEGFGSRTAVWSNCWSEGMGRDFRNAGPQASISILLYCRLSTMGAADFTDQDASLLLRQLAFAACLRGAGQPTIAAFLACRAVDKVRIILPCQHSLAPHSPTSSYQLQHICVCS